MLSKSDVKLNMIVEWLGNSYIVVSKSKTGVLLKQTFSIGIILNSEVPYNEIKIKI